MAQSRFTLTNTPVALPGSCYLCGSASRPCYVDLHTDVEYHGAMYICVVCIEEMAGMLGFISEEKSVSLVKKVTELEQRLAELQTQADLLEKIRESLSLSYGHNSINLPPVVSGSAAVSSSQREEGTQGGETPLEDSRDKTLEQGNVKAVGNVRKSGKPLKL